MRAVISANGLTKTYGEIGQRISAVRDVSLEIDSGGITTLMGPSGSGKSTLLAMLSGLLHPDAGTVTLLDRRFDSLGEVAREEFRRRHCGFVFQQYNLFPALTALQQVEIALEWASTVPARSAAEVARRTLTALGLGGRLHLRPQELSGGEKQRVAVARALAKRPRLIFADEPTAALDWAHGKEVLAMLQGAADEHDAAVVLVSHDPRALPFSRRVLYLEDGRLVEGGVAAEGVPR